MMAEPFVLAAALLIQPFSLVGASEMAGPPPIRRELQPLPEAE